MVKEVSDHSFQEVVLGSELPALVDFWAPWCGPCQMVSPTVEKLSNDYAGKVNFCKVNVDEAPETAGMYGIMSIPTLMLFKGGKNLNEIVGAVPESSIRAMIHKAL
jgi:thioredoxin 1